MAAISLTVWFLKMKYYIVERRLEDNEHVKFWHDETMSFPIVYYD